MVPRLDTSVGLAGRTAGDDDHRGDPSVEQLGRDFCRTLETRAEHENDIAHLHTGGSRIELGRDPFHSDEGCPVV